IAALLTKRIERRRKGSGRVIKSIANTKIASTVITPNIRKINTRKRHVFKMKDLSISTNQVAFRRTKKRKKRKKKSLRRKLLVQHNFPNSLSTLIPHPMILLTLMVLVPAVLFLARGLRCAER